MEFENITEKTPKAKPSQSNKFWNIDFVNELKSDIQARVDSQDLKDKKFRLPMSLFTKEQEITVNGEKQKVIGFKGNLAGKPIIPAHNLVLRLLKINYETDKENRKVVCKVGDGIEVDLTKMTPIAEPQAD